MSLISQNAVPKEPMKKKKASKENDLVIAEEVDDGNDGKRNKKRKVRQAENDEKQVKEMKRLESFLFSSLYNPVEFGKDDNGEAKDELDDSSPLFFTDKSANSVLSVYEEDMESDEIIAKEQDEKQRKPVWVDDEEEKASINIAKVDKLRKLRKEENESVISGSAYVSRLRAQHKKMNPSTDWADPDARLNVYDSEDDSDKESEVVTAGGFEDAEDVNSLLRTNEDLVSGRTVKLLPGHLEYSRLVDINVKDQEADATKKNFQSASSVKSVQFHKNGQLCLVGMDNILRLFQVDGKKNEMMQRFVFDHFPIDKAAFLPDGSHAIISGRRKFAYSYDVVKNRVDQIGPLTGRDEKSLESFEVSPDSKTIAFLGNEGYILLVSSKTKDLIGTLKMNGTVRSVAFTNDGQQLLSTGGDGRIYHWDMRTRTCFNIGVDEGCLNGTSLCVAPTGNLFAAGSDSGIVNIYNRDEFLGGKKKPLKAIENLTTKVDFMKFNHDAQILAISSRLKKNSTKLIHVPSLTVFSNWPPANQTLKSPTCLDFSPHGGFMALGNSQGKVLLYRLHHYHKA